MKEMCKYVTPYVCPVCNNQLLFFTSGSNKLVDYKGMMQDNCNLAELKDRLKDKHIKHIKCITCDKTYIIDWSQGYPVPLTDKSALIKFGYK